MRTAHHRPVVRGMTSLEPRQGRISVLFGTLIVAALTAALGLALLTPPSALAGVTRPFVRQITGTPSGSFKSESESLGGFPVLGGIAVDAQDDLWVGDLGNQEAPFRLDEFEPAAMPGESGFVKTLSIQGELGAQDAGPVEPQSLAIDPSGRFYAFGRESGADVISDPVEEFSDTGAFIRQFGPFSETIQRGRGGNPESGGVAVDDSTDPLDPSRCALGVCTVYVSHGRPNSPPEDSDGLPPGVERFGVNASGEAAPAPFTASASYIEDNEITGTPTASFAPGGQFPSNVAVDSEGNIYMVGRIEVDGHEEPEAVYEYAPSGLFVREFSGVGSPNASGEGEQFGFGKYNETIRGLAVDPVTHDLLLAIRVGNLVPDGVGVVEEFSSAGVFLGMISGVEVSSGLPVHLGEVSRLAVDSAGDVYAVDESADVVDVWGQAHALPTLTLAEASERNPESAILRGLVDPSGLKLGECRFEYVTEAAFMKEGFKAPGVSECVPTDTSIPADESTHPVEAEIAGLKPGVTYFYRLSAATEGALGGSAVTEPLAFTTPHAPKVDSTSAADISSQFADLHAQIDPLGADTSYHFEYDSRAYSGEARHGVSVPLEDVAIGSGGQTGSTDVSVVQRISGLAPGAEYHFRVVAENEIDGRLEVTDGPDSTFATLPPTSERLPDGRAYELVSPSNKGSAEDMFADPDGEAREFTNKSNVGYPSESGEEFILETKAAFGSTCGGGSSFAASGTNVYVFRRDPAARCWQTVPLASPALGVQSVSLDAFDPDDFSLVGIFATDGSEASAGGTHGLSLLGPPGGPYQELHEEAETEGSQVVANEGTKIVGGSRDLSHVVVESLDHTVLSGAPGLEQQDAGSHALYEWVGGEFTLASVNPEGSAFRCGAVLGQGLDPTSGRDAGHDAVSTDGSRIFLTAPDPHAEVDGHGCWGGSASPLVNAPQLYMRSDGQTIEVSKPEKGVSDPTCAAPEEGCRPAVYVGASEDGSRVFFITQGELTKEAAELELHEPELYECEIVHELGGLECHLTRISAGDAGSPAREPGSPGAHVWTVPAISSDGSTVYFTAFGALAPGAPALQEEARGPVNLYSYDTATSATVYIATVNTGDYANGDAGAWEVDAHMGIDLGGAALSTLANWYTTPDGRYLLFAARSEPTGYDTVEATSGACPRYDTQSAAIGHCSEVYRYDSELPVSHGEPGVPDNPMCVSCDRSGARPDSNAFFAHPAASSVPAGGPVRAMSDDGLCVFFDSADPLVTQAENHTLDVYEWEAQDAYGCKPTQGAAGCQLAQGCVSLISSGDDPAPSFFLGASADGSNVFFGTHARLVPEDTDSSGDLYDARIDGGFPVPGGSGPCEGTACQNPPPAPIDATPGSLTFSGAGNIAPAPPTTTAETKTKKKTTKCARGKRRSHGKCARAKTKARKSVEKRDKRSSKGRR